MTEHSLAYRDRPRRHLRALLIAVTLLSLQVALTAVGMSRHATSIGLGHRASFSNVAPAMTPRGYYVGNEVGIWCLWQLGWLDGDPAAGSRPMIQWSRFGLHYGEFGDFHIRFVGVSVLWTIVPNVVWLILVGAWWWRARNAIRHAAQSYDRGFACGPPLSPRRFPTCGQVVRGGADMVTAEEHIARHA